MKQLFLMVSALVALGTANMSSAETSMSIIVEKHGIEQCKTQILFLAEEVIGPKEHRLHMDQPKRNADKYPFSVTGIIAYNDQEAHIHFTASPLPNNECEVAYVESFTLPETCVEVREQVFKKWEFIGRLSQDSFFLRHKENFTQNATLSSTQSGSGCLVTRRDSGI